MKAPVILIYEKDRVFGRDLERQLNHHGSVVAIAKTEHAVLRLFQNQQPELVILCAHLKDVSDEFRIIKQIRRKDKIVPIILIAKYSSEALAIAAIKAGVNDFFKTPWSYKELMLSIKRNLPGDLKHTFSKYKKVTCRSEAKSLFNKQRKPTGRRKSYVQSLQYFACNAV